MAVWKDEGAQLSLISIFSIKLNVTCILKVGDKILKVNGRCISKLKLDVSQSCDGLVSVIQP
jgi:hypothetical protein